MEEFIKKLISEKKEKLDKEKDKKMFEDRENVSLSDMNISRLDNILRALQHGHLTDTDLRNYEDKIKNLKKTK